MPTTLQAASTCFLRNDRGETAKPAFRSENFLLSKKVFVTLDFILLVCSDPFAREHLNRTLTKKSYSVRNASWDEQVLFQLCDDISVVLLDARGDPEELELCRQIRYGNADMPIVVLDEPTKDKERISLFRAYTRFYLVKPCFNIRVLRALSRAKKHENKVRNSIQPDRAGMTTEKEERRVAHDPCYDNKGRRAKAAQQLAILEKAMWEKNHPFRMD